MHDQPIAYLRPVDSKPGRDALLRLEGISKRYGGVYALNGVDFEAAAGEIHALAGENGAGKSTLIKILGGIVTPDAGTLTLDDKPYAPVSPHAAIAAGVRVVHQEFNLLPFLSVAENVLFENLPRKRGIFLDKRGMLNRAGELLALVGLETVDPRTPVERLGIAQRQLVEIARALSNKSRVLILDEPTATLTPRESDRLFQLIHQLRDGGTSIIFISHHLEEIFEHCERVTVLRDGRKVATQSVADLTPPGLVQLMVGRHLDHDRISRPVNRQKIPALSLRDFKTTRFPAAPGINFDVHPGEIVGIAGLVGSGRTEVLRAIFGADRRHAGRIERKGAAVNISTPADAIANGICLVTENRKEEGLILPMSIAENTTIASVGDCSRSGFLSRRTETDIAQKMAKMLDIRMRDVKQEAKSLSGGNQQKVVLAKWLLAKPGLLMLDEPTRGIDVGAKAEIYSLLRKLADDGVGVLFVSSDVPEILGLADRVLVMSRGVLAGELNGDTASEEEILTLAYSEYLKGSQSNG